MNFPDVPDGTWSFRLSPYGNSGTLYLVVDNLTYTLDVDDPTPANILAAAPRVVADRAAAEVRHASHLARVSALAETLGIKVTG